MSEVRSALGLRTKLHNFVYLDIWEAIFYLLDKIREFLKHPNKLKKGRFYLN